MDQGNMDEMGFGTKEINRLIRNRRISLSLRKRAARKKKQRKEESARSRQRLCLRISEAIKIDFNSKGSYDVEQVADLINGLIPHTYDEMILYNTKIDESNGDVRVKPSKPSLVSMLRDSLELDGRVTCREAIRAAVEFINAVKDERETNTRRAS